MQYLDVSYRNDETGDNFELHKEIESPFVYDWINAMVEVLKLVGYGDGLIESYLGETYFTAENKGDCAANRVNRIAVTPPTVNVDEIIKKFNENLAHAIAGK